jgi:hypothetical protein
MNLDDVLQLDDSWVEFRYLRRYDVAHGFLVCTIITARCSLATMQWIHNLILTCSPRSCPENQAAKRDHLGLAA